MAAVCHFLPSQRIHQEKGKRACPLDPAGGCLGQRAESPREEPGRVAALEFACARGGGDTDRLCALRTPLTKGHFVPPRGVRTRLFGGAHPKMRAGARMVGARFLNSRDYGDRSLFTMNLLWPRTPRWGCPRILEAGAHTLFWGGQMSFGEAVCAQSTWPAPFAPRHPTGPTLPASRAGWRQPPGGSHVLALHHDSTASWRGGISPALAPIRYVRPAPHFAPVSPPGLQPPGTLKNRPRTRGDTNPPHLVAMRPGEERWGPDRQIPLPTGCETRRPRPHRSWTRSARCRGSRAARAFPPTQFTRPRCGF